MQKNEWVKYIQGEVGLIGQDGLVELTSDDRRIAHVRFFNFNDLIPCSYDNLFLLKTAEEVRTLGGEFFERRFHKLLKILYLAPLDFIHGRYTRWQADKITEAVGKWESLPDSAKDGVLVKSWKFEDPNCLLYVSAYYDAYEGPDFTHSWITHRNPRIGYNEQ